MLNSVENIAFPSGFHHVADFSLRNQCQIDAFRPRAFLPSSIVVSGIAFMRISRLEQVDVGTIRDGTGIIRARDRIGKRGFDADPASFHANK